MLGLRIVFRMYRHGGPIAATRIILVTLGLAAVLLAAFAAVSLGSGANAATIRASGRMPLAGGGASAFRASVTRDYAGTRPLYLVRVARVANTKPAPPPGCATFPAPGEACVSPALASLLSEYPEFIAHVGAAPTEQIGEAGLSSPDELAAYVGVPAAGSTGQYDGWGTVNGSAEPVVSSLFLWLVLALFVFCPGAIFASICTRLSAASRERRSVTLSLLGMDRSALRIVESADGAVAGVVAAGLAIVVWRYFNPVFARSGFAGYRWFASDSALPIGVSVILLVVVPTVAGAMARRGLRRRSSPRLKSDRSGLTTWLRIVPALVGLCAFAAYFRVSNTDADHPQAALFVAASATLLAGVFVGAGPICSWTGRAFAARARGAAGVLAWRRLQRDSRSPVRLASGAAVLVLVATIGSAAAHEADLTYTAPGAVMQLSVDTYVLVPSQIVKVGEVRSMRHYAIFQATPVRSVDGGPVSNIFTVVVASCGELAHLAGRKLPQCRDGAQYRAIDGSSGKPASASDGQILYDAQTGQYLLTAPRDVLDVGALAAGSTAIVIAESTPGSYPTGTEFYFDIANSEPDIVSFQSSLATISPELVARPQIDINGLRSYRAAWGIVRTSLIVGFVLGLAAIAVAAIDSGVERRRLVAHLTALGVSRRVLMSSQARYFGAAAAVTLGCAGLAGVIVSGGYLRLADADAWYWPSVVAAVAMAAVGTVLSAAAGSVVLGRRIRPEFLSRE